MTPERRLMGLFASAGFLAVCAKGFLATGNPLHAMLYGLAAALVLGFIGYRIGYIISHPKGKKKKKKKAETAVATLSEAEVTKLIPLAGDETFLEDVTSGSEPKLPSPQS